ncbi:MAG: tryptophan 7-halogenase [Paucibacter sp.]|nr:tryptophan 7-halogenase [Roseateles sp.]
MQRILIVGGGTSGWMTATALSKLLLREQGARHWKIELVESEQIGTIGVGEATIPAIKAYNTMLGLSEDELLRATQGSFKLGIEFVDWGRLGERYFHGFSPIGRDLDGISFHHYWLRLRQAGLAADIAEYSINSMAPLEARFMRARPDMAGSPLAEIAHAFHFDASLYAKMLRQKSEAMGVTRIEGRITEVTRHENGHIRSLKLEGDRELVADFFIDCSGLHGLLIEKTLQAGFEDWGHWLPCDRALAVPCESVSPLLPYTRSTAREAGWQWRIPLQHRIGNGLVYCSEYMDDEAARHTLLSNLDGKPLADPRPIRFRAGRRRTSWIGNCVAIGLASGFLEPLESTSIHLVQSAVTRLLDLFPRQGLDAADIAEYNRQTEHEIHRIRDFIVLHYKLTARDDTPFWRRCRDMSVPDTLMEKLDLFASNGRIMHVDNELFHEPSWLQVMLGQGLMPRGYHPMADIRPLELVRDFAEDIRGVVKRCLPHMPPHGDYVRQVCAAPLPPH